MTVWCYWTDIETLSSTHIHTRTQVKLEAFTIFCITEKQIPKGMPTQTKCPPETCRTLVGTRGLAVAKERGSKMNFTKKVKETSSTISS